ncbi:hypothetical protein KFE25_006713 [Diacronema lutheri]|uniref:Kinesin-like protein n=1 Tax=Diacronema lutheri TaxID=2081491 RepID=A0A8J6CE07_DIALT|nr:hypothetical protein KFE25_006713 [Diacronema lutheri]
MADWSRGGVRVCVRFRPQNALEASEGGRPCVEHRSDETCDVGGTSCFTFDRVFPAGTPQDDVYNFSAREVVESVLDGVNGTVIAYGQTSSGKTFTMEGDMDDEAQRGVVPRMVRTLFAGVAAAPPTIEFIIGVSMLEIYLERIRDLLAARPDGDAVEHASLAIHEERGGGVYVQGLSQEWVSCEADVYALLRRGARGRVTSATRMNEGSSRSHSVVLVFVRQREVTTGSVKTGKLCLVDLAGSESVGKTLARGTQLAEAKTINKSLSALGNVINALTADCATDSGSGGGGGAAGTPSAAARHVPYRDSKLTRVLQESLGGNARTALIVTCSSSSYNLDETLSSLKFGQRAKRMRNRPVVNRELSSAEYKKLLLAEQRTARALADELELLKLALADAHAEGANGADGADGAPVGADGADGGAPASRSAAESARAIVERLVSERDRRAAAEADARALREALAAADARLADARAELGAVGEASALLEAENDELLERLARAEVELARAATERARLAAAAADERSAAERARAAAESADRVRLEGEPGAERARTARAGTASPPSPPRQMVERGVSAIFEPAALVEAAAAASDTDVSGGAQWPPAWGGGHRGSAEHTTPADVGSERARAGSRGGDGDGDGGVVDTLQLEARLVAAQREIEALMSGLRDKISRTIELEIALDAQRELHRRALDSVGAWGVYDELEKLDGRYKALAQQHDAAAVEHRATLARLHDVESRLARAEGRTEAPEHAAASGEQGEGALIGAGEPRAQPHARLRSHVLKPRPTLRGGGAHVVAQTDDW